MKEKVFLGIDVGNTNIEIGILSSKKDDFTIVNNARFFTKLETTSDEFAFFIFDFLRVAQKEVSHLIGVIYSSVVPSFDRVIEQFCEKYLDASIFKVGPKIDLGIQNLYKNPNEVGADRLVNASFVHKLNSSNSVIIDMGTATTLCALTSNGDYLGGVIYPGIQTSLKALITNASKLPGISIIEKKNILADNTAEAIQSGLFFSNLFALKGMILQLAKEVDFSDYFVIATGGFSQIFASHKIFDSIEPQLTLKGLKHIIDLNFKK